MKVTFEMTREQALDLVGLLLAKEEEMTEHPDIFTRGDVKFVRSLHLDLWKQVQEEKED